MLSRPLEVFEEDGLKRIRVPETAHSKLASFGLMYLQDRGFFNEYNTVDSKGYVPWFTYPAIDFIRQIVKPEYKVFEFGAGYSTLFWASHSQMVCSIEHDAEWAEKIMAVNENIKVNHIAKNAPVHEDHKQYFDDFIKENFSIPRSDLPGHDERHGLMIEEFAGYASSILSFPKGHFDIIVVDGMARQLCGYFAALMVNDNPDGYIILDNSERWHYNSLQQYLINNGFGRIDFWGPSHGTNEGHCTSVFSKRFRTTDLNSDYILRPVTEGYILV